MFKKMLRIMVAFGLVGTMAVPLAHEIYQRHTVWQHLGSVMSVGDRAALEGWRGSTRSFVEALRDRCARTYGSGAPACEPYRTLPD
jgi:hypothetical protein